MLINILTDLVEESKYSNEKLKEIIKKNLMKKANIQRTLSFLNFSFTTFYRKKQERTEKRIKIEERRKYVDRIVFKIISENKLNNNFGREKIWAIAHKIDPSISEKEIRMLKERNCILMERVN